MADEAVTRAERPQGIVIVAHDVEACSGIYGEIRCCVCECPSCWSSDGDEDGYCLCPPCEDPSHNHSQREEPSHD